MAKGNLFQGLARGSVGDVVFSRRDGQQVSRVRNRNPRNPDSSKQRYQRAIMATAIKAYEFGKEIFDHAFEMANGKAGNQQQFVKLNADLIRAGLVNDKATGSKTTKVVPRGATSPVTNRYIVSKGTYDNRFMNYSGASITFPNKATADETVAAYAVRNGLVADDLYTIVAFVEGKQINFTINDQNVYETFFVAIRLRVKSGLAEITDSLTNIGQLLEVDFVNGNAKVLNLAELDFDGTTTSEILVPEICNFPMQTGGNYDACWGVIRSREDSQLRSTTQLESNSGEDNDQYHGITEPNILDAWSKDYSALGNSAKVLEGGLGE